MLYRTERPLEKVRHEIKVGTPKMMESIRVLWIKLGMYPHPLIIPQGKEKGKKRKEKRKSPCFLMTYRAIPIVWVPQIMTLLFSFVTIEHLKVRLDQTLCIMTKYGLFGSFLNRA